MHCNRALGSYAKVCWLCCTGVLSPTRVFPIVTWLPQYNLSKLIGDAISGLTVGLMVLPQGMAYASIAGLPPIYGIVARVCAACIGVYL